MVAACCWWSGTVRPHSSAACLWGCEPSNQDPWHAAERLPGSGPNPGGPTRLAPQTVLPQSKQASVTLLNDYIVLGSLGKGAYGSVKLCYSMLDDSLYALKVGTGALLQAGAGMRELA